MERHLLPSITRRPKRHLNINELFLSPSFHPKQPRLFKQEGSNQNRSLSPLHQRLPTKRKYSSSYTSLKEFNLSEKDFLELRKALQTIFHYFQPKIIYDNHQHLTSPYLQQRLHSIPLYTNEYFIRNGLLNHNDGPEIYDNIIQSRNLSDANYSSHLKSCSPSFLSSVPLALLSNQKYLLTALTSNFASEKSRYSRSSMDLNMFTYQGNGDDNETKSMMIRKNKVRTWERENILQTKMSVTSCSIQQDDEINALKYHRSSIVRTPSTSEDEKTVKMNEESMGENRTSIRTCNEEEENGKLLEIKNTDDLFPMVKILAPYIIIRDSFHRNSSNCIRSMNMDNLTTAAEKRSPTDVLQPALITAQHQSLLLPSSSPMNPIRQTTNEQSTNYLLAEFESVLTQISKQ